jgi:hypothetical protein
MPESYQIDFPELAEAPATTYIETLINRGLQGDEALVKVIMMDLFARSVAVHAPMNALAFAAPETISTKRIMMKGPDGPAGFSDEELAACIDRAVPVIRGEANPPARWKMPEAA